MKKRIKSKKGITLVSLVVTIIVLIILAGISLNLTIGNNGILTIAKKAKQNTELAKLEEETMLNELYQQIALEDGSFGDISYDVVAKMKELNDKIAELEREKTEKEEEIIEKNKQIEDLSNTIDNLREQINNLNKEKEELIASNNSKQEEINRKDEQIEDLNRELTEAQDNLAKAQEEISNLNNTITNLNNQIKKQQETIASLQEELTDVRKQLLEANTENENLREEIKQKDTQIANLNSQVAEKQQTITNLQLQIESKDKEIANLKTQVTNLINEKKELQSEIESKSTQIKNLQDQITSKNTEITNLNKQIKEQQATIKSLQDQINSLNATLNQTTADAGHILKGYKAYSKGKLLTGTMENRGAVSQSLNAGGSYTIPAGYHNGSGKVTANSLASQTQATAKAGEILSGKTAWVNGSKITGTMPNRGNLNWNPSSSTSYTVPAGYYSGGTISTVNAYNLGVVEGNKIAIPSSNIVLKYYGTWCVAGIKIPNNATTIYCTSTMHQVRIYENFDNVGVGQFTMVSSGTNIVAYRGKIATVVIGTNGDARLYFQ